MLQDVGPRRLNSFTVLSLTVRANHMSLIYQWSSVFNQNMIMIIPSQHFRTIQKFRCQKHKHCVIPRYKQSNMLLMMKII